MENRDSDYFSTEPTLEDIEPITDPVVPSFVLSSAKPKTWAEVAPNFNNSVNEDRRKTRMAQREAYFLVQHIKYKSS